MNEIKMLQSEIVQFSKDRNWDQFHNGKDLAMGLCIESSELLEAFLWKSPGEASIAKIKEELADVFNYALLIATKYNLDVSEIVLDKIKINSKKYPIEKSYGKSNKYDDL